jgi:vanillate O-demethylase ferredoxin subunit
MTAPGALELVVAASRDLAAGIRSLTLKRADGGDLPGFTAGAHIDVEVTLADGTVATRSYSIASAPGERSFYEIGVLRERQGAGGSAFMHDRLAPGTRLRASEPRSHFPLAADAAEHLLIAGGIGITPILAMLRVLAAEGRRFEMHYCARSPAAMAFRDEVAALAGARAHFHFDGGDPARGLDLRAVLAAPQPGRHVYLCGPKAMIEAGIALCRNAGWPAERVHFEFFAEAAAEIGDQPIELALAKSGRTLIVAADQTILAALIEAGLDPLSDCRRGECGVCVTGVLAGEPLHRDHYLTDAEKRAGKSMCVCISRAQSKRLVLDL